MSCEISYWLSLIHIEHPVKKRIFRYQLHQLIWLAFPKLSTGNKQPFLFSLDERKADSKGIYCLVQSQERPDWTKIIDYKQHSDLPKLIELIGIKKIRFLINIKDQFTFRLIVCPVKNIYTGQNQRGKRVSIFEKSHMDKWFIKKSIENGFKPLRYDFYNDKVLVRRQTKLNAKEIPLSVCRFNGYFSVKDPERCKTAILEGIGPKKIFGFGMLQLSRPI